jgi:hypothetical protein
MSEAADTSATSENLSELFEEPSIEDAVQARRGWYYSQRGFVDEWDEWHSSDYWEAERTLWETPLRGICSNLRQHYYGLPWSAQLKYKLTIYGRRDKNRRLRPVRFTPELSFGQTRIYLPSVNCSSMKTAFRKADTYPELEAHVQELMRKVYSKREAVCVFRKANGHRDAPIRTAWERILTGPPEWYPWATLFHAYEDSLSWPTGEYMLLRYDRKGLLVKSYCEVTEHSSGGSVRKVEPDLEPWFKPEDES